MPCEVNIDDISLNDDGDSSSGFGDTTSSDESVDVKPTVKKTVKKVASPPLSAKQKHINRRNARKNAGAGDGGIRMASSVCGANGVSVKIDKPQEEYLGATEDQVPKKKNLWSKVKSRVTKTMKAVQSDERTSSSTSSGGAAKTSFFKKQSNSNFDSII